MGLVMLIYLRSYRYSLALSAFFMCVSLRQAYALDVLNVTLYQAEVFEMPEGTTTLIVGNPIIADVTVLKKGNKLLITGKGFGETNVLAIDNEGNLITETLVRVSPSNENKLIVQRGTERESYSCAPRCMPTVNLGDAPRFISEVTAQIQANTTAASGH
jgi:Pilus formation protein N terminal region